MVIVKMIPKRSTMSEHEIAEFRLNGFRADTSRAAGCLRRLYPGGELTRGSLHSLATVLSALAQVELKRDWIRWKDLIVKPYFAFVRLDAPD
jgi:hypothetical protein